MATSLSHEGDIRAGQSRSTGGRWYNLMACSLTRAGFNTKGTAKDGTIQAEDIEEEQNGGHMREDGSLIVKQS